MTSINNIRDDVGIHNSKIKEAKSSSVQAPNPAEKSGTNVEVEKKAKLKRSDRQRRGNDRRQNNRRNRKEGVLLDTRSHHDRRRGIDRRHTKDEHGKNRKKYNNKRRHIDEYS